MAQHRHDGNESVHAAEKGDLNPDPITGEPGAHPVGTGAGAAGGAVAGAALGSVVGGPVGAAIGGAIGAVSGGAAGSAAAEKLNPTEEDAYWRENFRKRPYADETLSYDHYRPAYRYGWESRVRFTDRRWDEVERELERGWRENRGESRLGWPDAKLAARDAWQRVDHRLADEREQ
ncbi:MAG TPA: hypothetical protein VFZ69_01345 [Longimicrobiales bacterium]